MAKTRLNSNKNSVTVCKAGLRICLPWLALLTSGLAYYAFFRSDLSFLPEIFSSAFASLISQPDQPLQLSSPLLQSLQLSFPSFIHAAAFAWLIVAACRRLNLRWDLLLAIHVIVCVAFELTTGTTSVLDIIAVLFGTFVAAAVAIKTVAAVEINRRANSPGRDSDHVQHSPILRHPAHSILAASALTLSTVFTLATSQVEENEKPVYMSYAELRDSVRVISPRNSISADRVYLYDDYLILNEKNNGLHVIDNSNPEEPQNIGFIQIPGNTEVSIKRGFLYADSYIDLVTVDIRSLEFGDIDRIGEVNRVQDIFPYDAYQNIPDGVYLGGVDQERGVVVGYRRRR